MQTEQFWENVFTPYRRKILYPVAAIGAGIFLPLAVYDFMQGRELIGAILVCLVAMLATDAIALSRRKAPPVPFALLIVPACAGVGMSLAQQGIYGALWSFPVMILAFFAMPRAVANLVATTIIAFGTLLLATSQDFGTTLRYFLSLSFSLAVINIMLNVITSMHQRLIEQTITDPLTGAFNRRHMDDNVEEVIERFRRTGAPASALVLDIDHFKQINDRKGHEAGDETLKAVVSLVRERCRKLDMIFRQGGEEFLVLLPDTRTAEAMMVAENLRRSIADASLLQGERVTVSIGVGELRANDDAKVWLKRVDDALYRAKKSGRNRVTGTDLRIVPSNTSQLRALSAS
jgi:diguanylate cyclase (GGDEF)-like protein